MRTVNFLRIVAVVVLLFAEPALSAPNFVGVIAVVSDYKGTLQLFNFSGVACKIENALTAFALKRGYSKENISIYKLDGKSGAETEPTESKIRTLLYKKSIGLNQDDTLVFHFLGHGASEGRKFLLLGSGAESTNEVPNRISSEQLDDILSRSKAGLRVAFIDACQILANAQTAGTSPYTEDSIKTLQNLVRKNKGMAIFLSTGKGKPAWIDEDGETKTQIGFFTKKIVDVFQKPEQLLGTGDKGSVMAHDLAEFLRAEVSKDVKRKYPSDDQEPMLLSEAEGGSIYLFGTASMFVPTIDPVKPALVLKTAQKRGAQLDKSMLSGIEVGDSILRDENVPSRFDEELLGSCLTHDMESEQILRWGDVGAIGLCDK